MYDDANVVASPLWVRIVRMTACFALAALLAWRGATFDSPYQSTCVPFLMCQFSAFVLSVLGLLCLDGSPSEGPA
jgi:hypothetical protein